MKPLPRTRHKRECWLCLGDGAIDDDGYEPCPECEDGKRLRMRIEARATESRRRAW